jgi:tetratricopeptide (TPR) repeat protein
LIARALAILALLACGTSFAEVSPAARAKAKTHIKKARAAYADGNYDQAVAEYQAAYKLVPAGDILFNLGQIQRVKDDKPAAVASYRKYLDSEPDGAHAGEAREHLAQLTRAQVPEAARDRYDAVEKAVRDKPGDAATRFAALQAHVGAGDTSNVDSELAAIQASLQRPEPAPKLDEPTTRRAVAATVASTPARPVPSDKPYLKKWWFWTAVGGGALIVVGAITGIAIAAQPKDPTPTLGVLQ